MASSASGVSFDSDPIRLLIFPHTTTHHKKYTHTLLMDTGLDKVNNGPPPPTTIQYHDLPNGGQINEMDFFANKKHEEDHSMLPTSTSNPSDIELDCNINTGLHLVTGNTSSDQSVIEDGFSPNSEDKQAKTELAMVQAELERMNMENKKLREVLNQVTLSYNALQAHVVLMMQQQKAEHQQPYIVKDDNSKTSTKDDGGGGDQLMTMVPRPFMDLGLAAVAHKTDENSNSQSSSEGRSHDNQEQIRDQESPEQQHKTDANKTPRLGSTNNTSSSTNIDPATEATIRKARVSVRARSEAPMIADGCQWRKYGQKMAKGNPCPRAYYRCTMAAGCPVRKQVQRCAEDRTILVTTYEGTHSHPLPPAALAMASTTSSAARMLLSGSMPSSDGMMNSNFLARTFLSSSSSIATISASAPFPTVSLDLTQTPNPLQMQRASQGQFQVPFSNSSGQQNFTGPTALLPQIFGQALYNQSKFSGLQMSNDNETGISTQLGLPQLYHQRASPGALADTVTALTADPNFSAALAAAITSVFGGGSQPDNNGGSANYIGNVTTNTDNNNGSATTTSNNSHGNKSNNRVNNSSFQGN